MKAKVKETGEIIEVKCLYSVIYSRLDCNGKIIEEYDEDELELITPPRPKMIPLDRACEWLIEHSNDYLINDKYPLACGKMSRDWLKVKSEMFDDFRKAMED